MTNDLSALSDVALDREARRVAQAERDTTIVLLRLLIEVERRGLHLALGHSSLFVYCTRILRLSEQSAYRRITAARAAKRYPRLLEVLADGSLTLSSLSLLVPQLTDEIADSLIEEARFKSTRDVERLIAAAFPQPDVPTQIRACPGRHGIDSTGGNLFATAETKPAPAIAVSARTGRFVARRDTTPSKPRAIVAPISPEHYFLKATISGDTHTKLERVRALLRHTVPDGDVDAILNRALSLLLEHVVRAKTGVGRKARKPGADLAPKDRSIPAAARREVWRRDRGRCTFAGPDGLCGETGFLEFHHVIPFAAGGPAEASNLQLRCRAHNAYEARLYFGYGQLDSARAE
jgi:hypothetical protein